MNYKYGYKDIEQWYQEDAPVQQIPLEKLIAAIKSIPEERGDIDEDPAYAPSTWEAVKKTEAYHYKTGCIDDVDAVGALHAARISYESKEMGATRWLVLTPTERLEKRDAVLPLLVVFHEENYDDPFWSVKTLKLFDAYIREQIEKKDRTILFIVSNFNGPVNMFKGMITEGIQNYCGDRNRVLVDVSHLLRSGVRLSGIKDFAYVTESGEAVCDPDACIEKLGSVSVLNFSRRWVTPWRPHRIDGAGDGTVDREWMIHSELGRRLLLGNQFGLRYKSPEDPEVQAYWNSIGLNYHAHYVHGERWVIFTPQHSALDKLPLVLCYGEVNEPDDQSIAAFYGDYEAYCRIAAQGDCAVVIFAMEDPRWNDWFEEIVQDAAAMYPIDLSRVYMTGHSHNGHFTQEFARRKPNVLAAIAPLGNSPGLPSPAVSHEAVAVDDERAAVMETIDMPTCILCGCKEVGCLVPVNAAGHAFEAGINVEGYAASAEGKMAMWNRRLKAERCPQQTEEELLAAADSSNKVERVLGFPCERTEIVYIDGLEHYVADIRNNDGKYHFRVVAIENMPHMTLPSMHQMAWNYMRRFARDQKTGEIIELW